MQIEDFIRDCVLYLEDSGLKRLEDFCYQYIAEHSGFSEKELREKTNISLVIDDNGDAEVRMMRKFTFSVNVSPETKNAIDKVFGNATDIKILPFKSDK